MQISGISINVNIIGTIYANIVYIHYLRNATFQVQFIENNDVMAFLPEFTNALNSGSGMETRPNSWQAFCGVLPVPSPHLGSSPRQVTVTLC